MRFNTESNKYGGCELNGFDFDTINLSGLVNKPLKWDWVRKERHYEKQDKVKLFTVSKVWCMRHPAT